jgi:hypothetical protein
MSKGNTYENDLMKLLFQATAIANVADNAAASPLTSLYVSLHTADPGEAGNQLTSECAYGSYARVAVARSGAGWTVTNNTATNAALVQFPQCTSGSEIATYVCVGSVTTGGSGKIFYSGALSASLSISSGIQPQFAISGISISED